MTIWSQICVLCKAMSIFLFNAYSAFSWWPFIWGILLYSKITSILGLYYPTGGGFVLFEKISILLSLEYDLKLLVNSLFFSSNNFYITSFSDAFEFFNLFFIFWNSVSSLSLISSDINFISKAKEFYASVCFYFYKWAC